MLPSGRYPTFWEWTKKDLTTAGPDNAEIEAELTPVRLDIVRGEGCGEDTLGTIQQQVTLKIKCKGCSADACKAPGKATIETGSLHVEIGMGEKYNQRGNGSLSIEAYRPCERVFNPNLALNVPPGFFYLINGGTAYGNNVPWPIEGATTIAEVKIDDRHKYHIDFYSRDGAVWDGLRYTHPDGSLLKTITIENPDAPTDRSQAAPSINRVKIDDAGVIRIFTWDQESLTWTLADGAGTILETTTETMAADGSSFGKTRTVYAADGENAASQETTTYNRVIIGTETDGTSTWPKIAYVPSTTLGTGDGTKTVTETYYDSSAPAGSPGKLQLRQETGQPWERYEYDAQGSVARVVRQLGHNSATSATALNRETEYQHGTYDLPSQARDIPSGLTSLPGRLIIEREGGVEVGRRYELVQQDTYSKPNSLWGFLRRTVDIQCVTPGAASTASSNVVTTTRVETAYRDRYGGASSGWPSDAGYVEEGTYTFLPSGRMIKEYSDRVLNVDSPYWCTQTADSGEGLPSTDGRSIVDGEHRLRTLDTRNRWLTETTYSEPGGVVLETATVTDRDFAGQPSLITYSDGSEEAFSLGTCCGPASHTDRAGVVTSYTYDAAGRRETETSDGVRARNVYDGDGHVLEVYRGEVDGTGQLVGTEQRISKATYNTAGQLTETQDAAGRTTTILETIAGDGTRKVKSTLPGGGTSTELYDADGTLLGIGDTGDTAAYPRKYELGVAAGMSLPGGGTTNARYVKEIMVGEGGSETEWTKTYTDMLGHTFRVETAAAGSSHPSTYEYNTANLLVKSIDPDGVVTLYDYNAKGDQEVVALDLDRNGTIDYGGTDRVSKRVASVTLNGEIPVRRVVTSEWQQDGTDTATEVSRADTTPNGLHTWSTAYGLTTESVTTQSEGVATTTAILPDGSSQITVSDHGRVTSVTRKDSTGAQIGKQTMSYADPFKRLTSVQDARDGTTDFEYYDDDQLEKVTQPDPDGAGPLGRPVTRSLYDAAGRKSRDILPDGGEIFTEYWPSGSLKKTYGARTYPVSYGYDPQGRLKTMTTQQGEGTGLATTTWVYSPEGRLQQKKYQDNKGPSYTYTFAGRLATRLWARGITTTYGHNNADDVDSITYDDGVTPSVSYGYNRRGFVGSVSDASGSRNLTYTVDGQPDDDQYTDGMFAGITVNRGYDDFNRLSSLTVPAVAGLVGTSYGYDYASRLETVTSGTLNATYTREPNSDLVKQIDIQRGGTTVMTTAKSYDSLDRLTSISSVIAGQTTPVSFSAYLYNAAGQRTQQTREDGSYWSYRYDALGQLTAGNRKWSDNTPVAGQQFGYNFDQIGNRTSTTVDDRGSTYTPNLLNQYQGRTVPGAMGIQGQAKAGATVTVNGQPTVRKGEYFSGVVKLDNSSAPVDAEIKITAVQNSADSPGADAVSEQVGKVLVPKNPEIFSYDDDGNIVGDGRFNYVWDGENRLTQVTALTGTPDHAKIQILVTYDSAGRRVEKKSSTWDALASVYTGTITTHFIYDAANLLAELDATGQNIRGYCWGADLGGTVHGAGGIGGLIAIHDAASAGNFLNTYDGSGNITALIDANSQEPAAIYESGPFAENIRQSGAFAKSNPFRWSTKYYDEESGLSYYGGRYLRDGFWLDRDPGSERGSFNLYAFVGNRPTSFVDPDGRAALEVAGGILTGMSPGMQGVVTTLANAGPASAAAAGIMVGVNAVAASWAADKEAEMYQAKAAALAMEIERAKRKRRKCKCTFAWIRYQLGGNARHNSFAAKLNGGTPAELVAITPEGQTAVYDAASPGPFALPPTTVYEVKTGYRWVNSRSVNFDWLIRPLMQFGNQYTVAKRCELDYEIRFDNTDASDGFEDLFPDLPIGRP